MDDQRLAELSARYGGRWAFFRYLTGLGFTIYNRYKDSMDRDVLEKCFMFLLRKDGVTAEQNVTMPMYWDEEPMGMECTVSFLINGNVVMDVYIQKTIGDQERQALKNKMRITRSPYGMICNFADHILYTEKYTRDKNNGIIDKI